MIETYRILNNKLIKLKNKLIKLKKIPNVIVLSRLRFIAREKHHLLINQNYYANTGSINLKTILKIRD